MNGEVSGDGPRSTGSDRGPRYLGFSLPTSQALCRVSGVVSAGIRREVELGWVVGDLGFFLPLSLARSPVLRRESIEMRVFLTPDSLPPLSFARSRDLETASAELRGPLEGDRRLYSWSISSSDFSFDIYLLDKMDCAGRPEAVEAGCVTWIRGTCSPRMEVG